MSTSNRVSFDLYQGLKQLDAISKKKKASVFRGFCASEKEKNYFFSTGSGRLKIQLARAVVSLALS